MKVLITDDLGDIESLERVIEELRGKAEITYRPGIGRKELLREVSKYEVLIVRSRVKVDREVMEAGERLRVIITTTHGLDHIDLEEAKRRGIEVINIARQANSVAELVIGLIFCLARGICIGDREIKRGRWVKYELIGMEVEGKTLGVIGFGRIGSKVAEKGRVLGMRVLAYDVRISEDRKRVAESLGIELVDLETLLRESDFITIHVPKTRETEKLLSTREFELMKRGVFLINASRGEVVDEAEMLRAIEEGKLGGIAVDVYSKDPFTDPVLRKLIGNSRVLATPHIGGQTKEARVKTIEALGEILKRISERVG